MTWWFTTFTAPEIKEKVHFLNGVEYLYGSISPEQLDIPQFIMDKDSEVCIILHNVVWLVNTHDFGCIFSPFGASD